MTPDQEKILIELHDDMKLLLQKVPTFVTWKALGGTAITLATLAIALVTLA